MNHMIASSSFHSHTHLKRQQPSPTNTPLQPRLHHHHQQQQHHQPKRSLVRLNAFVPEFPRLGGDTIQREWLSKGVPQVEGVNADDINKLFVPDITSSMSVSNALILIALAIAFVYWEGGELIDEWKDDQVMEALEEEYAEQQLQKEAEKQGVPISKLQIAKDAKKRKKKDELLKERRRGLGWLALVTALLLWIAGGVNTFT